MHVYTVLLKRLHILVFIERHPPDAPRRRHHEPHWRMGRSAGNLARCRC
jgi:hypothetical protein